MHTCTLELDVVTELNGIFYSGMGWAKGNVLKSNFLDIEMISKMRIEVLGSGLNFLLCGCR